MLPAIALAALLATATDQEPPLLERVEISRVVIDARIVDGRGRVIPSLQAEQFRVEVDGTPVRLASVDWIDETKPRSREGPQAPQPFATSLDPRPTEAAGRLLVFLFQKDFQGSRMSGLLRMKTWAAALSDALTPGDRAAVLTFDSHLRLHADFTNDRARLRDAITRSVVHEWPKPIAPGPFPSLAAHLDAQAALDAASPETALLVLGRALARLPGAKSILLFGWGLGRLTGGTVMMESDYGPAQRALAEARATVFALDITDADYHTLEVGLKQVAEDTGGFYARTHDSPAVAMARLTEALAGYYVITFEKPPGRRGSHQVNVSLVGRKGTVLARSGYVD